MLWEHLSQAHDAASRRFERIDRHVDWIHAEILEGRAANILDLGCGPGLYASRLASLGHVVHGIDFSPASIEFARAHATDSGSGPTYALADIRTADFGLARNLVHFLYGELNVFRASEARALLVKARKALAAGGQILLEVSTAAGVRAIGERPPRWWTAESGLFSDLPHLGLSESVWIPDRQVSVEPWLILDALSGSIQRFGSTTQAYSKSSYRALLRDCGLKVIAVHDAFGEDKEDDSLQVIQAIRTED